MTMPRFVVLSKSVADGVRQPASHPDLTCLPADVEQLGGRVVEQHALLGTFDVCTIVDIPEAEVAHLLTVVGDSERVLLPAIDISLFKRLLSQSTETAGPHRWQVSLPARAARRVLRSHAYSHPVKRWCRPFTVLGSENLDELRGPAIFIANHSSHLDGPVVYCSLPRRYRSRVAIGAAADRFFVKDRKGITKKASWNSLAYNMFPIQRGGGRAALEYAEWLIDRGWSIVIFPEGGRSTGGKFARFRVGPAIVAINKRVPVVPIYVEGVGAIRPKGSRTMQPGPVTTRISAPLFFDAAADPHDATHAMYKTMTALRAEIHQPVRGVVRREPALSAT
jgi:1-acyl-sn-glycerol-3-phosphate acyltransferase